MSKFWASSSSSSSDENNDSDSDDSYSSVDASSSSSVASLERADSFSTPTRQPILPVDDPLESWRRIRPHQTFSTPPSGLDPSVCTRIVCISDTHGYHRSIPIPTCDILIHGGDFSNYGEPDMVADVSDYFSELLQSGKVKDGIICIAGNHELTFEPDHYDKVWNQFQKSKQGGKFDADEARRALKNCTYLEDEAVTVQGIQIYGSPWTPEYFKWAFNAPRSEIDSKWQNIPTDTDVLITHGPPLGRGDVTKGNRVGCVSLMREVQSRTNPRLHVFGHIHDGYGVSYDGTTMYVNASNVYDNYTRQNPSIVVDLPHDPNMPAQLVKPNCKLDDNELVAWLRQNEYDNLIPHFEESKDRLKGIDIIEQTHDEICCRLLIHRDEEAKAELKQAVARLRVESFH